MLVLVIIPLFILSSFPFAYIRLPVLTASPYPPSGVVDTFLLTYVPFRTY
jgi:hypothetical protein